MLQAADREKKVKIQALLGGACIFYMRWVQKVFRQGETKEAELGPLKLLVKGKRRYGDMQYGRKQILTNLTKKKMLFLKVKSAKNVKIARNKNNEKT